MRHSRAAGPPSTQSGSSASGRGLVRESYRDRGSHIPGVMVPGDPDKGPSKNRTKVIIILGIALPVLACIIGIIAWSVTTDVLRISPRAHDNAFNRFGHQGKTRIDTLQPRNDEDIDIFQLHSISAPVSTFPSVVLKVVPQKTSSKPTSEPTQATILVDETSDSPKVSDIISRLISDMPVPKNPKNFVVFAPVADAPSMSNPSKGRRFDGKLLVHEGEDLIAEESSYSEEVSQEAPEHKILFSRKRKSSRESSLSNKPGEMFPLETKQDRQVKRNQSPHSLWESSGVKSHSQFIQRPDQTDTSPKTSKHISSSILNNNSGLLLSMPNVPQHLNHEFSQTRGMKTQEFKHNGNQEMPPNHNLRDVKKVLNYQQLANNSPPYPRSFRNQVNGGFQNNGNSVLQNDGSSTTNFQQKQKVAFHNQQFTGLNHGKQSIQAPSLKGHPPPTQNYQSPSQQIHNSPLQQNHNSAQQIHNFPQQQILDSPAQQLHKPPHHFQHSSPGHGPNLSSSQGSSSLSLQGHVSSPPPQSLHSSPPQSSSNQGLSRSTYANNPQYSANSYPVDNGYQSGNNGPQYFAPPPQTFHTKTSYDNPSNKFGPVSSVSSYERAAQSAIDQPKDGLHHHHHHHHHHEPMTSNSDPIGDVNLSDVPRSNDADRLGTIGLGVGGPRGITVQIGGGGGGGGLTGLLPLGALGIAKNIVASLLPRPALGLNSKVFLGVEVGRGGGLNLIG